jgi:hypothetical protein
VKISAGTILAVVMGIALLTFTFSCASTVSQSNGKKGYELQPMTMEDANELEQSPTGREWR